MQTTALVITGLLMLLGLVGTALPGLPGAPLIWVAIVLYGYMERFAGITVGYLSLTALALATVGFVEHMAHSWGARTPRYSRSGAIGAALLGLLCLWFWGPAGLVVGPVAGAVAGELAVGRAPRTALRQGAALVLAPGGLRRWSMAASMLLVASFVVKLLR